MTQKNKAKITIFSIEIFMRKFFMSEKSRESTFQNKGPVVEYNYFTITCKQKTGDLFFFTI